MLILLSIMIFLVKLIALVLTMVLTYLVSTFLSIYFPVNRTYSNVDQGLTVYLSSDGIHTDFVFPIRNEILNWKEVFDQREFASKLKDDNFLRIGWGDKGFFLDIPTWKELTPKVALRAMCMPSQSLLHIKEVENIPNDKKYLHTLVISKESYLQLAEYILSHLSTIDEKPVLLEGKGYTVDDNFYYSGSKYHALNTCNVWVAKALASAGIRTSIWSPSAKGIFYQLKRV